MLTSDPCCQVLDSRVGQHLADALIFGQRQQDLDITWVVAFRAGRRSSRRAQAPPRLLRERASRSNSSSSPCPDLAIAACTAPRGHRLVGGFNPRPRPGRQNANNMCSGSTQRRPSIRASSSASHTRHHQRHPRTHSPANHPGSQTPRGQQSPGRSWPAALRVESPRLGETSRVRERPTATRPPPGARTQGASASTAARTTRALGRAVDAAKRGARKRLAVGCGCAVSAAAPCRCFRRDQLRATEVNGRTESHETAPSSPQRPPRCGSCLRRWTNRSGSLACESLMSADASEWLGFGSVSSGTAGAGQSFCQCAVAGCRDPGRAGVPGVGIGGTRRGRPRLTVAPRCGS